MKQHSLGCRPLLIGLPQSATGPLDLLLSIRIMSVVCRGSHSLDPQIFVVSSASTLEDLEDERGGGARIRDRYPRETS